MQKTGAKRLAIRGQKVAQQLAWLRTQAEQDQALIQASERALARSRALLALPVIKPSLITDGGQTAIANPPPGGPSAFDWSALDGPDEDYSDTGD